jgi:hypothetical protein
MQNQKKNGYEDVLKEHLAYLYACGLVSTDCYGHLNSAKTKSQQIILTKTTTILELFPIICWKSIQVHPIFLLWPQIKILACSFIWYGLKACMTFQHQKIFWETFSFGLFD